MSKVVNWRDLELLSTKPGVVLCHGCFDLFHVGHLLHLEAAKKLGQTLVVTITCDFWVKKAKGDDRPLFNERLRLRMLAGLACVDYASIAPGADALYVISAVKPRVYAKGGEYRGKLTAALSAEATEVERNGGKLLFTDEIEFHSTKLMEVLRCG